MGIEHYKQMYADALALDCKALPVALQLKLPIRFQRLFATNCEDEQELWMDRPFDAVMRVARKLVVMHEQSFLVELRELAAAGRVELRAKVLPTVSASTTTKEAAAIALAAAMVSPSVVVDNPEYLGCDDRRFTEDEFYDAMGAF